MFGAPFQFCGAISTKSFVLAVSQRILETKWVGANVPEGKRDRHTPAHLDDCFRELYYSILTARSCLPRTLVSIPSGGRKSDPCTTAPRASTSPGRGAYLSGS